MAHDYGYGELENKLVYLFSSGPPDFAAAEELLALGANLNAQGRYDDENMLSLILSDYRHQAYHSVCGTCSRSGCAGCSQAAQLDPEPGQAMCRIIRFFLENGFDVNTQDGRFGAQCLWALVFSTGDRYVLEGMKLLLDAGAKNASITPDCSPEETPRRLLETEYSFQRTCRHNLTAANIYAAADQIYQALEEGRPYAGIDSWEEAVGKRILKVLALRNDDRPVFFPMDLPSCEGEHCFTKTLCFVYEGGALMVTRSTDFWVDSSLPKGETEDVSRFFPGVPGSSVTGLTHDYSPVSTETIHCSGPLTTLELGSGLRLMFSTNFGEVKSEETAAFLTLQK